MVTTPLTVAVDPVTSTCDSVADPPDAPEPGAAPVGATEKRNDDSNSKSSVVARTQGSHFSI